jgi:hypothetical protein
LHLAATIHRGQQFPVLVLDRDLHPRAQQLAGLADAVRETLEAIANGVAGSNAGREAPSDEDMDGL